MLVPTAASNPIPAYRAVRAPYDSIVAPSAIAERHVDNAEAEIDRSTRTNTSAPSGFGPRALRGRA